MQTYVKTTKGRYRMYADGTIVDQDNNGKVVGYINNRDEIEEAWSLSGRVKQAFLRKYLYEKEI